MVVVLEAVGVVLYLCILETNSGRRAEILHTSALHLAIAAALLTVIQHLTGPARMAASFAGIFDGSLQAFYLLSDAGISHGMRLTGMLIIISGISLKNRSIAVTGAILTCLSFVMTGHTVTHSPQWILALLLVTHISIIAFWFGSLRPLREIDENNYVLYATLLDRFSRIASRAVPIIFVAGLALSILLLGSFSKLLAPYGLMIIGKVAGFSLLMALASYNRWRLLPKIRAGDARAISTFRCIAIVEWLTIAAIIVATVSMTSLFSP